jgi:hypothetical protein
MMVLVRELEEFGGEKDDEMNKAMTAYLRIQAWIERIILHIKEVIILEGGNEYKEGRLKGQAKNRVH